MKYYFLLVYFSICKEAALAYQGYLVLMMFQIYLIHQVIPLAWNWVVLIITVLLNCLLCYHLYQVPSRYSHLLVNLWGKVFIVKWTAKVWRVWKLENWETETWFLITLLNKGYQSQPRKLFNVDRFKIKNLL